MRAGGAVCERTWEYTAQVMMGGGGVGSHGH